MRIRKKVFGLKPPTFFARPRIIYPFPWGISLALPQALESTGQGQLADGRCVVFGGLDNTDFQNTTTLATYVIAANGLSVTRVGDLPFAIQGSRTTLLGDGRVLLVDRGQVATLDPGTLLWTSQPSTSISGDGCCLVTLASGDALLMDGQSTAVQKYTATLNSWSSCAPMLHIHEGGCATALASNEVFINDRATSAIPEVYDVAGNQWHLTENLPSTGNFCQQQVLLPNGKLFTCCSGGTTFGVTTADFFNPSTRTFFPLPSYADEHSADAFSSSTPTAFYVGENRVVIFSNGSPPRVSWFDVGLRQWFGGGFDGNPDYTFNGESLDSPASIFYLGQPGATLGFLIVGHSTQSEGYYTPHSGGWYIERSQAPVNNQRVPTFNGTITVVQGLTPDRAFITWNAASDTITNVRDLNYYACAVQSSGDEDFNDPNNSTLIWSGSLSMEVRGLAASNLYYFEVAVRNMLGKNQPGTIDFQAISPEVTFTPDALTTPLTSGSWSYTASLSQPRSGPAGVYLSDGRYLVWGGLLAVGSTAQLGDIYSQRGLEVVPEVSAPSFVEGAATDASPSFYPQSPLVDGFHLATATGGLDNGLATAVNSTNKYFPYIDTWDQEEEVTTPGQMNEAVFRHAMVQFPVGGLLRMGGITVPGDLSTTTNTVELFTYGVVSLQYVGLTSDFTVGEQVVGIGTGARGKILAINPTIGDPTSGTIDIDPYSDVGFGDGEGLVDTLSGSATATGPSPNSAFISTFMQTWSFVAPMHQVRSQHSAICLNGYVLCVFNVISPFAVGEVLSNSTTTFAATVVSIISSGSNSVLELSNVSADVPLMVSPALPLFLAHITGSHGGEADAANFRIYRSRNVLVVGGKDETGTPLTSAEVYDGIADSWSIILPTPNDAHYLFPLIMRTDGKPLAVGGGTDVVEHYDPDAKTFTETSPLLAAKTEHTAHVFQTGHVGVFGGRELGGVVSNVSLYDPGLDSWSFQASMNEPRARHVSFLMPNNKVLVVGGEDDSANSSDTAEISPAPA